MRETRETRTLPLGRCHLFYRQIEKGTPATVSHYIDGKKAEAGPEEGEANSKPDAPVFRDMRFHGSLE